MKNLIALISLTVGVLLFGCQEYSQYVKGRDLSVTILSEDVHVKSVEIIDWKVGPMFKQTVSKGINVKMTFPMLREKNVKDLLKNQKANSWLIRVSRDEWPRPKILGYMYIPVIIPRRSAVASFNINYAAAAMSFRFENFKCPAMDHSKVISKLNVDDYKKEHMTKILVGPFQRTEIEEKVVKFALRPNVFNGGSSLEGEYYVELALYDFKGKVRRSNFVKYPEKFKIVTERTKIIKGCSGFKVPSKDKEEKKKFKFGR